MLESLYTAAEMRAAEEGHDVDLLMQRAGRAVATHVVQRFPDARSVTVVCGGGANGGDGRIAAGLLQDEGLDVRVVDVKPEDEEKDLGAPDVLVDAIFGTGFEGEPRPGVAKLIEQVNGAGVPVVAVDLPSGVDASTGEVAGAAVDAALSVTFHGAKVGHFVAPGRFRAGEVVVADIGLAPTSTEHRLVTDDVLRLVRLRSPRDNKYSAGAVLAVGGSAGMSGAICLTATAAFRADAGYVAVVVPESVMPIVEIVLLEAVKRPCQEDADGRLTEAAAEVVLEQAERATAVAIGPGLGRSDRTRQLVRELLDELSTPVVIDADGLWHLEPIERAAPTVLTPHAGELARLLGRDSAAVNAKRLESVRTAAERFGCTVLLKGADTLVASPGQGVLVCDTDAPQLATAGTGDVLTGVIGSFLAKGLEPSLAAAAGAVAHARAARLTGKRAGLLAHDVIDALPGALVLD
jgi:NAD(P)H-hydrate epimerase